jgi:hypothetical protein
MRLPSIKYSDNAGKYEQYQFGGIDRRRASGDGSIYDMIDISTDDYPILSTIPNRNTSTEVYDNPWYYGMADKPFVIAGKEKGGTYRIWNGQNHIKGDIVGYDGIFYECINNTISSSVPPVYATEHWKVYDKNTFQYDGVYAVDLNCEKGKIYIFNSKAYICKESHKVGKPSESDNWEKTVINWEDYGGELFLGSYDGSTNYKKNQIVCFLRDNKLHFYRYIFDYPQDGVNVDVTTHWEKLDLIIPVWSKDNTYAERDVVSKSEILTAEDSFYVNVTGKNNPSDDEKKWEEYTFASLYYDGKKIDGLEIVSGKKICTYFNDHILIYPDKIYYNKHSGEFGYLQGNKSGIFQMQDTAYIHHSTLGGKFDRISTALMGDSKNLIPGGTGSRDVIIFGYLDTNNKYDYAQWYDLYDLRDLFREGDSVKITDEWNQYNADIGDGYYIIREVGKNFLRFDTQVFAGVTITDDVEKYTVHGGECYSLNSVKIIKTVPDMDFVCVANNRVWGCKDYTVYASSLGNPYIWQNYTGLLTDAVYLEAGSDEKFTGCCEYGGYPFVFSENKIYKVYGSIPTNYALQVVGDIGVKKNASQSLCIVNSMLIYLAPDGVFGYTGGVPSEISYNFNSYIADCVAGSDGFKYYGVMNIGNEKRLWVYDTNSGIWSSEHFDGYAIGFARYENELLCMNSKGEIFTVSNHKENHEIDKEQKTAVIEFNDFYGGTLGTKDIGRIVIRASVDPKYNGLEIHVQYDSDEVWHRVGRIYNQNTRKRVCEFGFFPRKCDHFRIKLICQGKFTLYSIGREVTKNN